MWDDGVKGLKVGMVVEREMGGMWRLGWEAFEVWELWRLGCGLLVELIL